MSAELELRRCPSGTPRWLDFRRRAPSSARGFTDEQRAEIGRALDEGRVTRHAPGESAVPWPVGRLMPEGAVLMGWPGPRRPRPPED